MQLSFSLRAQFAALAVGNAIAIGLTSAQGAPPSPLLSQAAPLSSKEAGQSTQTSPVPELTKADFETFLDALIPSQLRNRNIAGAVVSVVKNGQVLFQQGYGYADFEAKEPVLPDQTLFRPGSISKLFTGTAVMPVAVVIRERYQRPLFTVKSDRVLYFLSRIVCLGELIFILAHR